ncbi:MAG: pimeloyl-ACP methyl ester carboxylesterase [Cocleimonas sp.]|jgi:pimeloyl-ACP methyl ester carboxylesterase
MKLMIKALRSFSIFGFLIVSLSACSSLGSNSKKSIAQSIQGLQYSNPISQQRVIIYNHGISRPQQTEPCYLPYNKPPKSLTALIDDKTMVYRLCSTATEAPAISSAGKQVYLRKIEIDYAIDEFLSRGIQPRHLFLAGHSNGGWTSLMMMQEVNKRFNGVIAYAPAFAGKRSEISYAPWWRKTVRPNQIKDMLKAPRMDALIFAYENDAYNRPKELEFLPSNYPLSGSSGVDLVSYDCGLRNAHQTFRKDCRLRNTSERIQTFINNQIKFW